LKSWEWYGYCCIRLGFGLVNGIIMIIVFNLIGAGILLLAIIIGSSVAYLFGDKTGALSVVVVSLVAIVLDVLYRRKRGGSLFHPRRGGHVSFIPVWIIGLIFLGVGYCGFISGKSLLPEMRQTLQSVQPNSPPPSAEPRDGYQAVSAQANQSYASLKLSMISGSGPHGLASINGESFAAGETHTLTVAQKKITVTCLEIRDHSVLAKVEGESQAQELKIGESKSLAVVR
jgi:hypothetical protein